MSPLSSDERSLLLRLARRSLEAAVSGEQTPLPYVPPGPLRALGAAFVSLHKKNGELRGCIGTILPTQPLYRTVMEAAASAARQDPRFEPVRAVELSALEAEVSVISPCQEVPSEALPQAVQTGIHGVMVSRKDLRGVLLPQVAVEKNWDSRQLLEEACKKAGLPPNAWERGAKVEIFTAEVFSEQSEPGGEKDGPLPATPSPQRLRDKYPPG